MTNTSIDETTPDELMEHFQGRSLKSIILFTVVIHAILLLGTSVPFLWKTFVGADNTGLTEEERVELAVKEATVSLREIAEEHGLKPQDLSNQFTSGAPKASKASPTPKPDTPTPGNGTPNEPADPKSALEKELDKKATGPAMPPVDDDDEDLFK